MASGKSRRICARLDRLDAGEMQETTATFLAVAAGLLPGEAVELKGEAMLGRAPDDVADLADGILRVGGDHLEVFGIEGRKFQHVHGGLSAPVRAAGSKTPAEVALR